MRFRRPQIDQTLTEKNAWSWSTHMPVRLRLLARFEYEFSLMCYLMYNNLAAYIEGVCIYYLQIWQMAACVYDYFLPPFVHL